MRYGKADGHFAADAACGSSRAHTTVLLAAGLHVVSHAWSCESAL